MTTYFILGGKKSGFECYCQIILKTDASKIQGTAVQGIESPSVPGRIIEPENFPSPDERNFPLLSDVLLPLCKANIFLISMQGYLGQQLRENPCTEKILPLQGTSCNHSPYNWGRVLRVVMSLKHPRYFSYY